MRTRASSLLLRLTLAFAFVWVLTASGAARSATILETASLGPTGQSGGTFINGTQMLGARFTLTLPTQLTDIGGHLLSMLPGGIFGAIVALPSPTGLPAFAPNTIATNAIAGTVFTPPSLSADVLTPLSVLLAPGSYALVFGSNAFGATGTGAMAVLNPLLGPPSFFFSTATTWVDGAFINARFVAHGNVVPEPATALLFGIGLAGISSARRRSAAQ